MAGKKKEKRVNKILIAREQIKKEHGQLPIHEWQDIESVIKKFRNIDIEKLTAKQLYNLNDFFVDQSEIITKYFNEKSKADPVWSQSVKSIADEEAEDDQGDDDDSSDDNDKLEKDPESGKEDRQG